MAFDNRNFSQINAGANIDTIYVYAYTSATDDLATVTASAYFNAIPYFKVGDLVYIYASDGENVYKITATSPNVTMTQFIASSEIGAVLTGANAANTADDSTVGGVQLVFPIAVTGGATANYDVVVNQKIRVTGVTFQFDGAGAASDTVQVFNGANAITEAFDGNQSDTESLPAVTINDANATVAAGGTLRVTQTDNSGNDAPPMTVYVHAYNVA